MNGLFGLVRKKQTAMYATGGVVILKGQYMLSVIERNMMPFLFGNRWLHIFFLR